MESAMNEPSNSLPLTVDSLASRYGSSMKDDDGAVMCGESKSKSMSNTEWTDEKHSLYLDSMEASFVQQLYTNNNNSYTCGKKAFSSSNPFGRQFKVLRDGQWGRIDFERNNNWKRVADEDGGGAALLLMNPWIRHFRSTGRSQTTTNMVDDASSSARKDIIEASTSSHVADYSSTEMTDQNFVDEDNNGGGGREEKEEEMVKAKRIRTWTIATPRKDKIQVKNKMVSQPSHYHASK